MLTQLINPPEFQDDHKLPSPGENAIVRLTDDLPVAVTGVLQCTAIFFYNPNNRRRVAAHFGGLGFSRRPNAEDLKPAWEWVTGEWGVQTTQVTICKNGSSPQDTIALATSQLQKLVGMPKITVEEYPGDCFYMRGDGELFGGGTPCPPKSTISLGSRGKIQNK